jgi:thioredoxin-related protein
MIDGLRMHRGQPCDGRGARAARGAIVLLAALGMLFVSGHAAAQGIVWSKLSVDEALAKAKEQNRVLMIDVFSEHCMQCKDLEEQLWDTADGAALGEDLIALQIESDGPAGERLRRLYPVLGLPLVIFIEPGGKEIGRVVGFRGLAEFLTEARNLKAGVDPLPALEAVPLPQARSGGQADPRQIDRSRREASILGRDPRDGPDGEVLRVRRW